MIASGGNEQISFEQSLGEYQGRDVHPGRDLSSHDVLTLLISPFVPFILPPPPFFQTSRM